jgi:hypothetical protein
LKRGFAKSEHSRLSARTYGFEGRGLVGTTGTSEASAMGKLRGRRRSHAREEVSGPEVHSEAKAPVLRSGERSRGGEAQANLEAHGEEVVREIESVAHARKRRKK